MDRKKIKNISRIIVIILIIAVVFTVFKCGNGFKRFTNLDSLISFIRHQGKYAVFMFLLVFTLKPLVLVIPATIMSLTAGIIFGPFYGFILSLTGFFISGTFAFFLARFLGKDFVDKVLKGKAVKLNQNLNKNGFKVLLLLRLPPVLPYDPVSYTCGLSQMKYFDFITSSVLGVVPETFCYCIMGENFRNPFSLKFLLPFIFIIFATSISGFVFKKAKKNK